MKRRIRSFVARLAQRILPYRPIGVSKSQWNTEYASGHWDRLRQLDQLAHYSIIVGYCKHFGRFGKILDVGCGDGVLLNSIRPNSYDQYLGIDLSEEAIRRAKMMDDQRSSFEVADAATFHSEQRFDTIVLNEVLYYFRSPSTILRKFRALCEDDGLLIVSMHYTPRTRKIWKSIHNAYEVADTTLVTSRRGNSHKIGAILARENSGLFSDS